MIFHNAVQRTVSDVVGQFNHHFIANYCWMFSWKNYGNGSIPYYIANNIGKILVHAMLTYWT